jgi:nicotinamide phosphoribosyltransferase
MMAGEKDGEFETFKRLITKVYPTGIVSIVSDTWDFWQVITDFLPRLKPEILNRNGRGVIRPDSGSPVHIIAGYTISDCLDLDYEVLKEGHKFFFIEKAKDSKGNWIPIKGKEIQEVEAIGAYEEMYKNFSGPNTSKGFKQLDTHVGLIYGDSITMDRQREILKRLENKGFCASNLVLGIGSFTYQYVTRDVYGMAMKATYVEINGIGKEIWKDPITDDGMKKSARGLIRVHEDLTYSDQVSWQEEEGGLLETVFLDGKIVKRTTLSEIRERVNNHLK